MTSYKRRPVSMWTLEKLLVAFLLFLKVLDLEISHLVSRHDKETRKPCIYFKLALSIACGNHNIQQITPESWMSTRWNCISGTSLRRSRFDTDRNVSGFFRSQSINNLFDLLQCHVMPVDLLYIICFSASWDYSALFRSLQPPNFYA